jgi:hypothetical protein
MKLIHVLPLLSAGVLFALPRISYAQFCVPGTSICAGKDGVTVTGPIVNQGAGAGASSQANTGGTAQGQGGIIPNVTVTPPKVDYTVEWQAYAAWRAQIQAAAKTRVRAEIEAEIAKNLRWTLPNPYIGRPLTPRYEGGGDGGGVGGVGGPSVYERYERQTTVGFLGLVVGNLSGRRSPYYFGYAFPIRVPVGDNFRVATDLSLLAMFTAGPASSASPPPGNSQVNADTSSAFAAFQFRPALIRDFVQNRNGSYAYGRAGAHLTTPLGGGANSPDFFYGPSAGVGLHTSGGGFGFGAEWNVEGWAAVGRKKDPDYNRFRIGTDVRVWLVFTY